MTSASRPRRHLTAILALLGVLGSRTASAQVASAPPAAGGDAVSVGFEHERAEARERLRTARELFERGNFDASLAEFRRLYDLLAGSPQQPRVLYNMAQCQEQLGRYDEALTSYRRYLHDAADAPNRTEVEATLRTLDGLLGTLRITTNVPGAEVWVDERRVGLAPGDVRVAGGRHTVQLRAPGHLPAQADVQLAGRSVRSVALTLERVPEHRGLRPAYFWSGVGATALVAGVGTIFGALALGANSDAQSRLQNPAQQYTVTEADRTSIRSRALAADVLFGTAGALAIGTVVVAFLTDFRGTPRTAQRWLVTPLASADGLHGAVVGGAF